MSLKKPTYGELENRIAWLTEKKNQYRDVVESVNAIILKMDADGTIFFFNRFAQEFFGYTNDEIVRQNIVGTIVPQTGHLYDLSSPDQAPRDAGPDRSRRDLSRQRTY